MFDDINLTPVPISFVDGTNVESGMRAAYFKNLEKVLIEKNSLDKKLRKE